MNVADESNEKKGVSGNRPAVKIFSFNTSVRNPKRNDEFLKAFVKFDGKLFDHNLSLQYLIELVKKGIYKFTNVSEEIKRKWNDNIDLTMEEISQLLNDNPQATGWHNRIMTSYIRNLKNLGFLIFDDDPKGSRYHIIRISKLGYELIDENKDKSIVYTKVLLGLHANNPTREAMFNQSRPFLNAIFVINEVNNLWKSLGHEPKGVLKHEFSAFILSMNDNDYKKAANDIIEYRKKFRYEYNDKFIKNYLLKNGVLDDFSETTIKRDYPDDVFRKFEMTGLFMSHGKMNYLYYNLSKFNKEKVDQIMDYYKDYSFNNFKSKEDYLNYLYNIFIPWETNVEMRRRIAKTKAIYLGRTFNENIPLEDEEQQLDRAFYSSALSKAVDKYSLKQIFRELMILSGNLKEESKAPFSDVAESLRLEYLLALAIGKIYGTDGLVSNIIYSENGQPMHWALGKKCDIMLFKKEGSLILEPTLLCTRDQQLRNETTSITRHTLDATNKYNENFKVLMIAPRVHPDTIDYFTYRSAKTGYELVALTISEVVGLFGENSDYNKMLKGIDEYFEYYKLNENDINKCCDYINSYKPSENLYL